MRLGGRDFDVVSRGTIEWDITLLTLLQGLGLAEIVMGPGESAEQLAHRVLKILTSSPKLFELLGCLLVPTGTEPFAWSLELQRDTASFIKRLHSQEDKAVIKAQIVSMVISFFHQGLLSMQTFQLSSPDPATTTQQPRQSNASEATATMETGRD